MKVKKTYGKQKTETTSELLPRRNFNETIDENIWKDDETSFDRLLKGDENKVENLPKKRARNQIRVDYNRDSSLDESKIQKIKSKPQKKRKPKPKLDESSPDELYEIYLEEKRKKQKIAKQKRDAVRNVQISTPVQKQLRKKKENLLFELSPIKPGDGSVIVEDSDKSRGASLLVELRDKRLKEIEEKERERMEKRPKRKRPLVSSENIKVAVDVEESGTPVEIFPDIDKILQPLDESIVLGKRQRVLGGRTTQEGERTTGNPMVSQDIIRDSINIPEIQISAAEDLEEGENSMKVTPEDESETKSDADDPANMSDQLEVPVEAEEIEQIHKSLQNSPNLVENISEVSFESSSTQPVPSMEPLQHPSSPACDLEKTIDPIVEEISKKIAKKSVAINLVPAVKNISYHEPAYHITTRKKSSEVTKKSVGFTKKSVCFTTKTESPQRVTLQPGKWRKSLVAWRKSQNVEKTSLRASTITKDQSKIERYSEKIVNTLGDSVLLEQSDEGNLHAALSILDASIKCAATFHDQRKTCQRQTSVFERSSIFYGLQSDTLIDASATDVLSARQIALRRCGQQDPLPFDEIYSESQLPNCCKIGEGVYGEVFMYKCPTTHQPIVLKIIPIEGDLLVNGEPQKRFDEILQEIVISMELSALRNGKDFSTDGFVNVKRVTCVEGAYPPHLVDEWELYRDNRVEGSDNDHPEIFGADQLYIVFELCNGGKDLEAFVFNNAAEAQSVFLQTALTLAVAEQKFQFEHRDLHWGNILIAPTSVKFCEFRIGGKIVKLLTHGVKVTIIDYSLSRMVYDGAILFDNLARDEELFQSSGDYQFDIYRLMRDRVENDFSRYEPYTNLLWLHYIVDKLINGARYYNSKTKKHRAAVNELMQERDELLNFTSVFDYINQMEI